MKKIAVPLFLALLIAGALYLTQGLASPPVSTAPTGADPEGALGIEGRVDGLASEGAGDQREEIPKDAVDAPPDPDPGPTTAMGTLAVRVLNGRNESVPEVFVLATTDRQHEAGRLRFLEPTDAEGWAVFEQMSKGSHWVQTDRGSFDERVQVEVVPGERVEVELEFLAGLRVLGVVLDPDERPLPGAEVWMSTRGSSWAAGVPVTTTNEYGRFEAFDVPAGASIGARADGFLRSSLADLDKADCSTGSVEMTLRVGPGGASLAGRVTGPGGEAIEGARIALGDARAYEEHRPDDTIEEVWALPSTLTDAEGRYVLESLPTGREVVRARALGFAIETTEVELQFGQRSTLDFELGAGGIVAGTVYDSEGQPVPGARIRAFENQLDEDFLQGGQVDYYGAFGPASTTTDDEGRFRITGVPIGEAHVYALTPRPSGWSQLGSVYPFVRRVCSLQHGEVLLWDPILQDGPSIRGTVSYRDGTPLTNVFINIEGPQVDGRRNGRAMYTVDGSFRFIQLPDEAFDLRVQVWDLPEGASEPRETGIRPGGDPLHIVADFDPPQALETSHLVVTVEAEEIPGQGGIVAQLQRVDRSSWRHGDERDGRWHFDLDPEHTYQLIVLRGERLIYLGEPIEAPPGSDLDLGTVRPRELGTLVVDFDFPPGLGSTEAKLWISHAEGGTGESFGIEPGLEITLPDVLAGTWNLMVFGHDVRRLDAKAEVVAGGTTRTTLELTAAVPVAYTITRESGEPAMAMSIRFVDQRDGSPVHEFSTEDMSRYSNPVRWTLPLTPGGYALEVERGDGTLRRQKFTVPSLDPDEAPSLEVSFE